MWLDGVLIRTEHQRAKVTCLGKSWLQTTHNRQITMSSEEHVTKRSLDSKAWSEGEVKLRNKTWHCDLSSGRHKDINHESESESMHLDTLGIMFMSLKTIPTKEQKRVLDQCSSWIDHPPTTPLQPQTFKHTCLSDCTQEKHCPTVSKLQDCGH